MNDEFYKGWCTLLVSEQKDEILQKYLAYNLKTMADFWDRRLSLTLYI